MTAIAFDHPLLSGLLGDEEIAGYFTIDADIRAMLQFETALARAEASQGLMPVKIASAIADICHAFHPDIPALRNATARDGVVVPDLVRQLRLAAGEAAPYIHVGATSQDAIDTGLMLRLKSVAFIFASRLAAIMAELDALASRYGDNAMMGRTRMQAAIPIAVSDRVRAWHAPLDTYREKLTELRFPLQFGGAAGTLDKLGSSADAVRATLAQELGLTDMSQWQSQRTIIAEFADLVALISGSLGKFGQDVALMAQIGDEIALSGGGSSSAMAHKQNPVAAETLVALARFNATQISAIHHSMVHEQERSGAAWTLEWLVLPQMTVATGAALRLAAELCANIRRLGIVKS